jgi:2-dehydropantoate 2-reductase
MHEVIRLASCEGVMLTNEDYENDLKILGGLKPDGYPSMRQDAVAKRYSEVELFAGTVLKLAAKHGIDTPANKRYYEEIKRIESGY